MMDADLRSALRRQLEMRAERLRRLAVLDAPNRIIAAEAVLVLSTTLVLVGEELAKAVWEKVQTMLRDSQGICICGNAVTKDDEPLCAECMKLAEEEEKGE